MTERDKTRIVADLLAELHGAEVDLAFYREEVLRLAGDAVEFGEWMRDLCRPATAPVPIEAMRRDQRVESGWDRYEKSINFDMLWIQVTYLRAAKARVEELRERKIALGLR